MRLSSHIHLRMVIRGINALMLDKGKGSLLQLIGRMNLQESLAYAVFELAHASASLNCFFPREIHE